MMIVNIQNRPNLIQGPDLSALRMKEGVAPRAQRVTSIVLSILTALGSFVFLPAQAAFLLTAVATPLLLAWGFKCCEGQDGGRRVPLPNGDAMPIVLQPIPWYRRAINWIPLLQRELIPVFDPRRREIVGDGANRERRRVAEFGRPRNVNPQDLPGAVQVLFGQNRENVDQLQVGDRERVNRRGNPRIRVRDIPDGGVGMMRPVARFGALNPQGINPPPQIGGRGRVGLGGPDRVPVGRG